MIKEKINNITSISTIRNLQDRGRKRVDRAPCVEHAAHQRRAQRAGAADGNRHRAVQDPLGSDRRAGAAAGAAQLRTLPGR